MTRQLSVWTALTVAVMTCIGTAAEAQTGTDIVVRDAWVREATPADKATGAFMTIENPNGAPLALIGVEGAGARTAELHTMKMGRGEMMMMEQVKEIPVPARGRVDLKPGSFHVMLFSLEKPLVAGTMTSLTLRFSDGETKTVPVSVVKRSATGPR